MENLKVRIEAFVSESVFVEEFAAFKQTWFAKSGMDLQKPPGLQRKRILQGQGLVSNPGGFNEP